MKACRLLVVASLVAAACSLSWPAAAHVGNDPLELGIDPISGDRIGGVVRVTADLDDVREWWIEVRSEHPSRRGFGRLPGPACGGNGQDSDGDGTNVAVDCSFDTLAHPDGAASANGAYVVRLTADERHPGILSDKYEVHAEELRVMVVNAPAAPTGVSAVADGPTAELTLRWDRNPEPDVLGYLVEEAFGSGSFEPVGESATTSFHRSLPKAGSYRYRVAATRPGEAGKPSVQGPWTTSSKIEFDPSSPSTSTTTGPPAVEPDLGNDVEDPVSPPEPQASSPPSPAGPSAPGASTRSPATTRGDTSRGGQASARPSTAAGGGSAPPTTEARPAEPPDPGYSERLPYRKPPAPKVPVLIPGESVVALPAPAPAPETPSEGIPLPPLAVGLMLFVVAMTLVFVMRRPGEGSPSGAPDALSDWSV